VVDARQPEPAAAPIISGQSRQVRGKVPSRRFGYVSVVHAGKLVRMLRAAFIAEVHTIYFSLHLLYPHRTFSLSRLSGRDLMDQGKCKMHDDFDAR